MLIKVKTLTGKEIELDIDPEDPVRTALFHSQDIHTATRNLPIAWPMQVSRIKEKVEEQSGVPPPQQRLIFAGRQMADDKLVKEFNIAAGAVLHLVLALRGGAC
ncbi:hypothetical protein ONZ51_g9073 [Trametes cubensis]|uniref:Ubiquitin-like domain-containing protein n=1 Tax=Trametes cubensis TaxID=1111947 RepID=A0AAD7TMF9_9APHY|nr:hypothetical protein ONZ51_g9073 [Trametes cubensis]